MADIRWDHLDRTFLATGNGFQFSSPPPADIADERHLRSDDIWEVLACVLARLQRGQFQAANLLVDVMHRHDGALVWNACAEMIGFAGPRQLQERLVSEFADQLHTRAVQLYVSSALVNGCGLWVVPQLLRMHKLAVDDEARVHLEICLSRLLETVPGPIWAGPANIPVDDGLPPELSENLTELDFEGYDALVEARYAELRPIAGPDEGAPIVEGRVFDLEPIVRGLLQRIGAGGVADRIEWGRMLFEATTGVPCGEFYGQDWQLRPLAAAVVLEDFLESGAAKKFEPGVRYFFGHRIPG
jgi:hypothetical protein